MPDSCSRGGQLWIRHEGEFYLVYAASDCYTETSFWSSETSYMDLEIEGKSTVVTCSGPAQQQGGTGRCYRSTAWGGSPSVQSWRLSWSFSKSEYSFLITANSLCPYWCLIANITLSRRKRKKEGRTCSETRLTSAASRMESGKTKNLNFTSNWHSLPDPVTSRPTLLALNWQQCPKEEVPLPSPWPQTLHKDRWDTVSREGYWESKPHPRTAAHNGATSDVTDLPRAKGSTSSSTQVTDTACVAFISCSKPQHLVEVFFLWQTPEICWHWFLCGSTAAYTAEVLRPPSIQERYFLIMGVFCQILCPSFPV